MEHFQIGFLHLVIGTQGSTMSFHGLLALLFLALNYVIVWMDHRFSVHLLMDIFLLPHFGNCV